MNPVLVSVITLALLLLGAYGVAVLEYLVGRERLPVTRAIGLPLVEAVEVLRQEDLTPAGADTFLFRSAPLVAFASVALGALVIPLGPGLVALDPSIGLFYFIVVLGPFVVAMMNAGWGQDTKTGLFGSFRAAAHLLSYEVPLGFAAIGPVMAAQSLSITHIVAAQSVLWYVVWQPLGLAIYLLAALFVTYRHPFDGPLAGSELRGGVLGEYSGARFLIFRVGLDSIFVVLMAMGVVLFFGGWRGPLLPGAAWMVLKTFALAALVLWLGRRLPRYRVDQMLDLSWKILLPASLVNVALVGMLVLVLPGGVG